MGAKYSYGVWERFAHQANTILRTFKNHPKSRSVHIFSKCSDLVLYQQGGFINRRWGLPQYLRPYSNTLLNTAARSYTVSSFLIPKSHSPKAINLSIFEYMGPGLAHADGFRGEADGLGTGRPNLGLWAWLWQPPLRPWVWPGLTHLIGR